MPVEWVDSTPGPDDVGAEYGDMTVAKTFAWIGLDNVDVADIALRRTV